MEQSETTIPEEHIRTSLIVAAWCLYIEWLFFLFFILTTLNELFRDLFTRSFFYFTYTTGYENITTNLP